MTLRRLIALAVVAWILGFFAFAILLPRPVQGGRTDAVVVPTGGKGRIDRGLAIVRAGQARTLLVSGVDREVKPREFAAEYHVTAQTMACCVVLGYASIDTRSNATEIAGWVRSNAIRSVRLVTSDWHMRRASLELHAVLPAQTVIVTDAVPTDPSLRVLFLEYNKFLTRWIALL